MSHEKILGRELRLLVSSSPQSFTLCVLNQQNLTLVLTISFPVLMKSALSLVGNVTEKMTVGIILMKMDVVSKNSLKIVSDQVYPGSPPFIIRGSGSICICPITPGPQSCYNFMCNRCKQLQLKFAFLSSKLEHENQNNDQTIHYKKTGCDL